MTIVRMRGVACGELELETFTFLLIFLKENVSQNFHSYQVTLILMLYIY